MTLAWTEAAHFRAPGGPLSPGGMAVLEEEVERKKQEVCALQLQLQSANGFASEDEFTSEDGFASEESESEVESTEGQSESESEAEADCESEASCESEIEPVNESESEANGESESEANVEPEGMCEPGSRSTVQFEVSYDGDEIQSGGDLESDQTHEFSSMTEFDSVRDSESEAGSDAVGEHMAPASHSVPAAVGTALDFEVEHQSISASRHQALHSSRHSIWSISSHDPSTGQVQYMRGDEEPMAGESGVCSSAEQHVSSVDRWAAVRHAQAAECNQESATQAPAVATSEYSKRSCLSGLLPSFKKMKRRSRASAESAVVIQGAAAAGGEAITTSPPDSMLPSCSTRKPMQMLKKLLFQQLSQQATKIVQRVAVPADVSRTSEQQQQQPIPEMAGANKQRNGKLSGFLKLKKAASRQAMSAGGGSVQEAEPSDLIPAVTQPSGVVQQADSPAVITTAEQAAKPSHQVRPMPTVCHAINDAE